jgi:hypothetical protein
MTQSPGQPEVAVLTRHFGLLHAPALNISMIVGAGVFITIHPRTYVFGSAGDVFIGLGMLTLVAGVVVFLLWSRS